MGFMDRAKKLAEQAQQKLDEAQKQFSQGQGGASAEPAGGPVRYDEHGRPIPEGPPAGEAPAPTVEPSSAPVAQPDPAAPPAPPDPTAPPAPPDPTAPPPPEEGAGGERESGGDGPDTNPDPFKPLQ